MVKHKCHQMFAVSSPSASIPLSVHIIYFIPVIYLVVSGWMKPCAPDCCSMREPSWTCGVQRRSMAIQSWIGGALSLCWSLRQAYCCRHIRPTTSQQRTTKLVLLRTFGVCSSTMTNARKTPGVRWSTFAATVPELRQRGAQGGHVEIHQIVS